ncbi:hypothetical protein [Haladaptatus sp. NG-WS-4]
MTDRDTATIQELLEESLQEEATVEQLFDELVDFEGSDDRKTIGRELGGLVGCGLGMVVGRKLGKSVISRFEGRHGGNEPETPDDSRERLVRQRVQEAFEVSKEEAKQILANTPAVGSDDGSGDEIPQSENTASESGSERDGEDTKSEASEEGEGSAEESSGEEDETDEAIAAEAEGGSNEVVENGLDFADLSDEDLQSLANELLDELERRKTAK